MEHYFWTVVRRLWALYLVSGHRSGAPEMLQRQIKHQNVHLVLWTSLQFKRNGAIWSHLFAVEVDH